MINTYVKVLGQVYQIRIKKYGEHPDFKEKKLMGWCDDMDKTIVLLDLSSVEDWKLETKARIQKSMRETLRHEITHAFLSESGLDFSTLTYDGPWSKNEEMIDWLAIQGPKLYRAWKEAGAL